MSEHVRLTAHEGGVRRLTIARPQVRNALDAQAFGEIIAACKRVAADREARVLVLAGEGQAFSAGGDFDTLQKILDAGRRFAVAELRASTTFTPGSLRMRPDGDRLQMANDIDQLLATSVSMGRMTRGVTGWDHLIQHVDFTFTGVVPGATITDSTGTGPVTGLFLVCYLGSGERMELPSGADSIVVTPFRSNEYQILPVGLPLTVTP